MNNYSKKYNFPEFEARLNKLPVEERKTLLEIALVEASANCRAYIEVHGYPRPPHDLIELKAFEKEHPYWVIQRYGLRASEVLGRLIRNKCDPMSICYWPLLLREYQQRIIEKTKIRKRVVNIAPTFEDVLICVINKNTLITENEVYTYVKSVLADDEYQLPTLNAKYKVLSRRYIPQPYLIDDDYYIAKSIFERVHGRPVTPEDVAVITDEQCKYYF